MIDIDLGIEELETVEAPFWFWFLGPEFELGL